MAKYKINMNPMDKVDFKSLHHQLNGLTKGSNQLTYSGECLLLKFSNSENWVNYTYFNPITGGVIKEAENIAVSPERSLSWLYYFLKDEVGYKYIDTIFPTSVFNP